MEGKIRNFVQLQSVTLQKSIKRTTEKMRNHMVQGDFAIITLRNLDTNGDGKIRR